MACENKYFVSSFLLARETMYKTGNSLYYFKENKKNPGQNSREKNYLNRFHAPPPSKAIFSQQFPLQFE
jgi:hypothetical protein